MRTYSIGLYEKAMPASLTWKEKLTCAKEMGYDYVEISIDETDAKLERLNWTTAQRIELVEMMAEVGVPIRSMCLSGHRKYSLGASSPEVRARSLEIMQKALQFADDLGIRIIQLAGYDVYYEPSTRETLDDFERNLRTAVDMAARQGVSMGFETMETDFMNTVSKAMKYVHMIDSPFLGVYPDCGNLTNAVACDENALKADFESGRGHLIALHLKETLPGKFREIPYTTGHVDFEMIISTAWQLGIRRYVTELWDVGKPTWKEDIRFARQTMTDILDRQA